MIRRRSFLMGMASSAVIARYLAASTPLRAETNFMFITGESEDPHFTEPYIDVEEWRDEPAPVPNPLGETTQRPGEPPLKARHYYVHGGFKGTDTKFTFYFPPKEQYQGRFYQATHQLLTNENSTPYNVAKSLAAGAYAVQTNQGGKEIARSAVIQAFGNLDPSIGNYRANAAAAKYSRVVAQRVYEREHRPYGYLYGGSGGAYQVMDSAQNTSGVWDGFIPYVMGNLASMPSQFLVRAHCLRVLKDKWPSVMDAVEPGGSGDMYAGLNPEEKLALKEATQYGFPPRAWFNYVPQGTGPLGYVAAFVPLLDPTYVNDFWTKPGYIEPTSSVKQVRIQSPATVERVIETQATGRRAQFMVGTQLELSNVPSGDLTNTDLIGVSGESQGKSAPLGTVNGNIISFALGANPAVVSGFKVGDKVMIDNSEYLALQTYYRHAIPKRGSVFDYPPVYDSFRNADGSPEYVQREVGPVGLKTHSVNISATQGKFEGRMIVVQSLMDGDALPWMAAWYQTRVHDVLGGDIDKKYRIWYTDNAQHTPPPTKEAMTHAVSYQGVLEQALRDLSAWVEQGVSPPANTSYTVKEGQVQVPATAAERKGIQPVVDLKANGGVRAEVGVGQPVSFTATVETPPGTGSVVAADWDFEGTGDYATPAELKDHKSAKVAVTASHAYTQPGTYFAAIRAASQREGDAETPFARPLNIGRVRIVVS